MSLLPQWQTMLRWMGRGRDAEMDDEGVGIGGGGRHHQRRGREKGIDTKIYVYRDVEAHIRFIGVAWTCRPMVPRLGLTAPRGGAVRSRATECTKAAHAGMHTCM
uniref:Uncharacterized protein n=1 Tax=Oryza meridionalis TaxID=40149 RepID=A0A0E0DPS9_9ORYZ